MSCDLCEAAMANPRLDAFHVGCVSCQARALACVTLAPETDQDTAAIEPAARKAMPEATLHDAVGHVLRWHGVIRRHEAAKPADCKPVNGSA